MSDSSRNTRRGFLKHVALGSALCATSFGQTKPNSPRNPLRDVMETDVLVVGGGVAGIGAALGAARCGAKTMLLENCGFFGGVAAWGCGMQINQMRPKGLPRSAIHEMLIEKLLAYGDHAAKFGGGSNSHALFCNTEYLKAAVLDVLDKAGCTYLVHTQAVDAIVKNDRITGVVIATKRGLVTVRAQVVVDCTGDADVACFSGAQTLKAEGQLSPQTLCFNTANVTQEQLTAGRIHFMKHQEEAKQAFPLIHNQMPGIGRVANGQFYYTNHAGTRDLGQFDVTDPVQFTQAECLSRRQVVQTVESWRRYGGKNLQNIELVGTGAHIGVRESRRVKGMYILTEEDAMQGRRFEDAVAWRSGHLDIGFVRLARMKVHDVPYRALLPEKIDGLLVAGRCISATHEGASAGKSMGNCMATGHAAGIAAALASQHHTVPRDVDVKEIRARLLQDQVDLDFSGQTQDWL